MANLPAPFRNEGVFYKIVPDKLFFEQASDVGYARFLADARRVVGPNVEVCTTWCLDWHLKEVDTLPRFGHLTCIIKEQCDSDVECARHLAGNYNSERIIIATQHPELYSDIARLPMIGYTAEHVLVFYAPSEYQLQFARLPAGERNSLVLDEASLVYKTVQKIRQKEKRSLV